MDSINIKIRLFLISTIFAQSITYAADLSIPSYEQQRKMLFEQQKKSKKAPAFTDQERKIMQDSAARLAAQMPDPGLKPGTKAPDFTLPNAFGKSVTLSREWKKGPVILVFYRGAWCPFCNLHLHVLNKSLPAFKKYNARLIAVTPQLPDKSLGQIKKDGYPFEILSDLNSKVMKSYRLFYEVEPALTAVYKKHGLDLTQFNGKDRNVLPVPGTFVIDSKGIIRAVHAEVDYKERMEPSAILKTLMNMRK